MEIWSKVYEWMTMGVEVAGLKIPVWGMVAGALVLFIVL